MHNHCNELYPSGLLDTECAPGQEQCHIHRPHYIYDDKIVISAESSLYFNNILHCTQYLCEVNIIAPTVRLDVKYGAQGGASRGVLQ